MRRFCEEQLIRKPANLLIREFVYYLIITFYFMYSKAELKQLKIDFWEGFASYCRFKKAFKHRKEKFILYDTKLKGVEMKFDVGREGAFVILELNARSEEQRNARYGEFETYRSVFDTVFSEQLVWQPCYQRESGEVVARIYLHKSGLDFHKREHWVALYQFMADNMQRMEDAFEQIREYLD